MSDWQYFTELLEPSDILISEMKEELLINYIRRAELVQDDPVTPSDADAFLSLETTYLRAKNTNGNYVFRPFDQVISDLPSIVLFLRLDNEGFPLFNAAGSTPHYNTTFLRTSAYTPLGLTPADVAAMGTGVINHSAYWNACRALFELLTWVRVGPPAGPTLNLSGEGKQGESQWTFDGDDVNPATTSEALAEYQASTSNGFSPALRYQALHSRSTPAFRPDLGTFDSFFGFVGNRYNGTVVIPDQPATRAGYDVAVGFRVQAPSYNSGDVIGTATGSYLVLPGVAPFASELGTFAYSLPSLASNEGKNESAILGNLSTTGDIPFTWAYDIFDSPGPLPPSPISGQQNQALAPAIQDLQFGIRPNFFASD